MTVNHLKKKQ